MWDLVAFLAGLSLGSGSAMVLLALLTLPRESPAPRLDRGLSLAGILVGAGPFVAGSAWLIQRMHVSLTWPMTGLGVGAGLGAMLLYAFWSAADMSDAEAAVTYELRQRAEGIPLR